MKTFYIYDENPKRRIAVLQAEPLEWGHMVDVWDIRLELDYRNRSVRLKAVSNISWARMTPGRCYWFEIRVCMLYPNSAVAAVCEGPLPRDHYRYWNTFQSHGFTPDVPGPDRVNWDTLIDFAPKLATTKIMGPVLDWMQEYMPEPWGLFPTDPLAMCRALCPYPFGGYDREPKDVDQPRP